MANSLAQGGQRAASAAETRGRKATGNVKEQLNKDGTTTFSIRVRWNGQRPTIRLGNELEGWNRPLADLKLAQVLGEIAAGTWRPPAPEIPNEERDPTLHEFATVWLERQRRDLDESTQRDYSHTLSRYILPEFRHRRLSEISFEDVLTWRDRLKQESEHLQFAKVNSVKVLDRHGRPKRAFGSRTINEAIRLLGQILDRAVESDHYLIDRNPAKGRKGLRVKGPSKPPRNHLEADELLSLIQAADLIDQGVTPTTLRHARLARRLRAQGKTWEQIGAEMGCAESTAVYRSRIRPDATAVRRRRVGIVVLALTGTRASEHTGLTWDRMDETHGRIVLSDAKSDAGIREIHMSPFVREEISLYKASLPQRPAAGDPVFPVRTGAVDDRHNLLRRLSHVVSIANELRREEGRAALPKRITPHTFRRTFITLCFQAGKDLVFVQTQAGHADWKTTLEIYTQQSSRTVDPEIRMLLNAFLGESDGTRDHRRAAADRAKIHATRELGA